MNKLAIAFVTAAIAAAPALSAQAVPATPAPQAQAHRMGPGRQAGHEGFLAKLNLTDAQKAQVKAIHQKYAAQFKSTRDAARPDMDAMRAARQKRDTATVNALRAKMRADMAPMQKVHEQEMAEVRAILTPDQQKQFDTMATQQRERMKNGKGGMGRMGGMWHGRGGKQTGTGAASR